MFDTAYKIAVVFGVILSASCIYYAINEAKNLKADYDEWLTSKRRAQYRKPAYKQMNKRWTQHVNREQLWEDVQK